MNATPDLDGPVFEPASGGPAKQLVVLCHGVGADGNDLIGLAPYWAPSLPDARFVSPHAPFPYDMAPFGRQWYSLQDRTPTMIEAGSRAAAPILDAWLDRQLAELGLDDSKLALVGFSQGTMMSLFVGLRRAKPCAGILGYSGRLVAPDSLASELRSRPPVMLVHGEADPVVPFESLEHARAALEAAGVPVEAHSRPGIGHSIDQWGLEAGARFLHRVLAGEGG